MKIIIAGGRNYHFSPEDFDWLSKKYANQKIEWLVSGDAPGADTEGQKWAANYHIPIWHFSADWMRFGKSAGPIRNQQMIDVMEYGDEVILFPGDKGTANLRNLAHQANLKVIERYEI